MVAKVFIVCLSAVFVGDSFVPEKYHQHCQNQCNFLERKKSIFKKEVGLRVGSTCWVENKSMNVQIITGRFKIILFFNNFYEIERHYTRNSKQNNLFISKHILEILVVKVLGCLLLKFRVF